MGVFGLAPVAGVLAFTQPGSFVRLGHYFQPLSAPQPLYPFAVHIPVLFFELGGDASVAVARMLLGKFVEAFHQHLVLLGSKGFVLLRTSGLPECSASTTLTYAQLTADVCYGVAVLAGRYHFPFNASLRMSRSKSFSAKSFLSLAFSFSSSLNCLASLFSILPYF